MRRQKHRNLYYVGSVLSQVWSHPSNRKRRLRAIGRAVWWQILKRLTGAPREIEIFGGLKLKCYPDSSSASAAIYFGGMQDFHEMAFLRAYLRPGDGFLDGGANIGVYTLLAASCVGAEGRVDSFEPTPGAFDRLRENVAINTLSQVHTHQLALDRSSGLVRLGVGWDVSNRLYGPGEATRGSIEVRSVSLDEFLPVDRNYAMAKLDLEGAEFRALQGAREHLERSDPPVWQLEITPHLVRRQGSSASELAEYLRDHDYQLWRYDADHRQLHSIDPESRAGNVLAISSTHLTEVDRRIESADELRSTALA